MNIADAKNVENIEQSEQSECLTKAQSKELIYFLIY